MYIKMCNLYESENNWMEKNLHNEQSGLNLFHIPDLAHFKTIKIASGIFNWTITISLKNTLQKQKRKLQRLL